MLASVLTKTVRDRALGMLIGATSVGAMLLFGMAVYRDIDVSFYQELPQAVLELMGIPAIEDVGGLSYGAMYDSIGAFVLAGLAIGLGASAVAGEEQEGTLGLLLGNPVSRRGVVLSKSVAMIVVTAVGALILWGWGALSPLWVGVDVSGLHLPAMVLALFLNALVYGSLALAIGSWTGSRGAASGASVAVMVVGYLAASLFPLTEFGWVGELSPWHYYNSSQPVINGADWGHMAVMAGLSLGIFTVASIGVTRRDLKENSAGRNVFDRLRAHPRTRKIMDRIAGSARVSRISIKTTSEFQGVLVVTSAIMFYMGLMMGPLYSLVPADIVDFFADFPDALIAMIGGVDMSTATGFLQAELFAITGPIAVIVLTVSMGSRALAGEEERHTMGLLLGNPVSRSRVIAEKTAAMVMYATAFGVATFLGTWAGVALGRLDEVTVGGIAATSVLLTLLGLVFGGIALAVGAATGRSRLASGTAAAAGVVAYFVWSFLPLSETFEGWATLSPFEYFLGSNPLANGIARGDAAVLATLFVVLVAVSIPLFQRRDLRG